MSSSPTIDDLVSSFEISLRAAKLADGSIKLYCVTVVQYGEWLDRQGKPADLDEITRSNITAWLADLSGRLATNTVRLRFRAMSRFCRWLVDEDEIDAHPMRGLAVPEQEIPHVPVFDDDDLAALIKACEGRRWQDRRDEAMLRVLIDCGIRVGELCGMTTAGTDLKRETAIVRGKGSKDRPIWFSSRTTRALDRWLRSRRSHKHASSDALFLSERGPITRDGVRWIIARRAEAAGLGDRVNPHRFRHTWASDFLLAGGQQTDLKRLAGWNSDVQLARYGASAADVRAMAAARRLRRGDRI